MPFLLLLPLLALAGLVQSLPWDGAKPTNAFHDVDVLGLPEPPNPTAAPDEAPLLRRQAPGDLTCGYFSANASQPIYCVSGEVCATNDLSGFGCCSSQSLDNCPLATACVDSTAIPNFSASILAHSDLRVCTDSVTAYCITEYLIDLYTYTHYQCFTAKGFYTVYATAANVSTVPTPKYYNAFFQSTQAPSSSITSTTSPTTSSSSSTTPPPSSSTTIPPSPQPSSSTPVGAIVGGVVGGIAAIAIIAAAVVLCLHNSKKQKDDTNQAPVQMQPVQGPYAQETQQQPEYKYPPPTEQQPQYQYPPLTEQQPQYQYQNQPNAGAPIQSYAAPAEPYTAPTQTYAAAYPATYPNQPQPTNNAYETTPQMSPGEIAPVASERWSAVAPPYSSPPASPPPPQGVHELPEQVHKGWAT